MSNIEKMNNIEYRHEVSRYFLSMASQNDLQNIISSFNNDELNLNKEKQDFLLSCTIYHPLALKFPPSTSYSRLFLKWLMNKVEEAGHEITEKLYLAYADVIQNGEKGTIYQHYVLNSELTVTLETSRYLVSHSTTGLVVWEAAKWLADWAIENKLLFKNKKVIELGSGLGLTGLVLCKLCLIQNYIFTDNSSEVLKILCRNISLNGQPLSTCKNYVNSLNQVLINSTKDAFDHQYDQRIVQQYNCKISVVSLDWNTVTTNELNQFQANILLAADVFYDPSQFDALIRLFHLFLTTERNRKVYIAYTERNSETLRLLSRKIAEMNLVQREMKKPQKHNFIYGESIPIRVYELSS